MVDNATFTGIESPRYDAVFSPNQPIHKTWRVRNTGSRLWGPDHKLVFTGGDQMGAPNEVSLPVTAPGEEVDIGVDLSAPGERGGYRGEWRLRNPQGTYFGDNLSVQVTVQGSGEPPPPDGGSALALKCLNCLTTVAPGETFRPRVQVMVKSGQLQGDQLRGDMLRHKAGDLFGAWEFVAVPGTTVINPDQDYVFEFYAEHPIHAPDTPGHYDSIWQVWRSGDWAGPEINLGFEVTATGGNNQPPGAPTLTGPGDWAVYSGNSGINLSAQPNGDPDGDAVNQYYFEIFESAQTPNSGWISSNSWSPQGLGNYGYQWRAKVRDSRGAESDWSEVRHFNITDPNPQIQDFHWVWCHEPWGAPDKICFCAQTTGGGLELKLNSANDGSDSGEWKVIGHGDTNLNCNDDNDRPPNWGQLERDSGSYRVRLFARPKGAGGWPSAATADVVVTLPPNQKPGTPTGRAPANGEYVNSKTVTLDWDRTYRTDHYQLQVSADPGFTSLLVDQTLPPEVSDYTYTFAEGYETVYWRISATGPYGVNDSNQQFHIDLDPPNTAIQPLPAVSTDTKVRISWGGTDAGAGLQWYHVQVRDGNRNDSTWSDWLVNTTKTVDLFPAQAGHTYYFRVRAMDLIGNWEPWPAGDGDTFTLVNPAAAPPSPWWSSDFAIKRNLVIQNNDGDTIPIHYPIGIHFDANSDPTAAAIYAASQAANKGDDVRVVYNNALGLPRFVQRFTPEQIDIWFPIQLTIPGLATDKNYQIYYGDPNAFGPPADIDQVFLPVADGNTTLLMHFQEGQGSQVTDTSGRGHNGNFIGAGWGDGYLGTAGLFNGSGSYVEIPHSDDFKPGAITLEAWIYLNGSTGDYPMVFNKDRYWLRITGGQNLQFLIKADGGDRTVNGSTRLELNQWYHIAATYDGGQRIRVLVNGRVDGEQNNGAPPSAWNTHPLRIGRTDYNGASYFPGYIQHVRISNVERTDMPYSFINLPPKTEADIPIVPPTPGEPDLAILGVNTYPNADGGLLVEALVQNQGTGSTGSDFYTDLYVDQLPTSAGDYSGSIQFWLNSPIEPGALITLTAVLTDLTPTGVVAAAQVAAPGSEITHTLFIRTDSAGILADTNEDNNINPTGVEVCSATPDNFEIAELLGDATWITPGEVQTRNFTKPGDQDWVHFAAEAGKVYVFSTSNLGVMGDTYLYLYDQDGTTVLAANDDNGDSLASRIEWTAPASGDYSLGVRHWNPNVAGCGTSYDLSFSIACPPPIDPPSALPGDLDGDGDVDDADLALLQADFSKTGCPGWIPADINQNGVVDIFDRNILLEHFGETLNPPPVTSTPTVTPTPTSATLTPTPTSATPTPTPSATPTPTATPTSTLLTPVPTEDSRGEGDIFLPMIMQ